MDDSRGGHAGVGHSPSSSRTVKVDLPVANGLLISEVRLSLRREEKLKAFVSLTFNEALVVRGIKIIEGRERLFVAMPSRPRQDQAFQDIVHPINQEARRCLESHVLNVYYDMIEEDPITCRRPPGARWPAAPPAPPRAPDRAARPASGAAPSWSRDPARCGG